MLRKLLHQVKVDKVELLTVYIGFCHTFNLQIAHCFRLQLIRIVDGIGPITLFIIWKTDTNFQVSNIL